MLYQKSQFQKRLESFLWRAFVMAAAFFIDYVATNIGLLELHPTVTLVVGLVLAEITKYLNRKA